MIACKNAEYPVLLILHGGPGSPDRPLVLRYNKELFEYFTVVCWDQRGSGLSYNHECLTEKITVDLLLSDLKCLVQHLLSRFGKQKIYLAGHSWGALPEFQRLQRRYEKQKCRKLFRRKV